MPSLLPHLDPDGLLEYSVVFTDRSLNSMSGAFQQVMRDISALLKDAYRTSAVAVITAGGAFGMESIARRVCKLPRVCHFNAAEGQILGASVLGFLA